VCVCVCATPTYTLSGQMQDKPMGVHTLALCLTTLTVPEWGIYWMNFPHFHTLYRTGINQQLCECELVMELSDLMVPITQRRDEVRGAVNHTSPCMHTLQWDSFSMGDVTTHISVKIVTIYSTHQPYHLYKVDTQIFTYNLLQG
jgi:hypothetical protein